MLLKLNKQKDYELLDSGFGMKLERYGKYVLSRPDPEALWEKSAPEIWKDVDLDYVRSGNSGKWVTKSGTPKNWNISFSDFTFSIKPTSFKHTGLFPEQMPNWQWMEELIKKSTNNEKVSVLNLFAYTGGASLASARAGAKVVHLDGSKTAVAWARENIELSGLKDAPVRFIVEDCISFLKREVKRGNKYDAIVMDPPSFGHGPKDELWKIEENFLELMKLCKEVLSKDPLFILINGYTSGYSPIVYENNLKDMTKDMGGKIEIGEIVICQSNSDRLLPCGIFARWSRS